MSRLAERRRPGGTDAGEGKEEDVDGSDAEKGAKNGSVASGAAGGSGSDRGGSGSSGMGSDRSEEGSSSLTRGLAKSYTSGRCIVRGEEVGTRHKTELFQQ